MTKIRPTDILELKKIVLDYLQGTPLEVIQVRLQTVCSQYETNGEVLYQSIIASNNDSAPLYGDYVKAILANLNHSNDNNTIEENGKNLYDFLSQLCGKGHPHLVRLLKMIDSTKPKKS